MERKLTKVVDETGNNRTEKMCSCGTDVVKDLCSSESIDTCGDGGNAFPQKKLTA